MPCAATITGTATQGQTLTADTSAIADLDGLGTFSLQWLRDGRDIASATGTTYALTQADVGKAISVRASYTDGGGKAESVTSTATSNVANVNDAPTGAPTITGTATQGQTLTADTSSIADADGLGTFSLQWLRDGNPIASATGPTYALAQADVGKAISVRVGYTDGGGTAESVTSGPTATVQAPPPPPPPPPPAPAPGAARSGARHQGRRRAGGARAAAHHHQHPRRQRRGDGRHGRGHGGAARHLERAAGPGRRDAGRRHGRAADPHALGHSDCHERGAPAVERWHAAGYRPAPAGVHGDRRRPHGPGAGAGVLGFWRAAGCGHAGPLGGRGGDVGRLRRAGAGGAGRGGARPAGAGLGGAPVPACRGAAGYGR